MKALIAIASYGTKNDAYLNRITTEYQSMRYDVDIVVLSNVPKSVGSGVDLQVGTPFKNPWTLPFPHKQLFADRANEYDLFIYSEDDILLQERNIEAFVRASRALKPNEIPGFLRFERSASGERNYPEVHGNFHWDPSSVRSRGEYTAAFFSNEHAACYILTRQQLQAALRSGGFLVGPHEGKYDLLCTAATDPYTQCGFEKVICISHLEDFLVHHLPNRYVGMLGVDDSELRRQVQVLLRIQETGESTQQLIPTESRLAGALFSKDYYEPIHAELVSAIPRETRSILSIGCGWGATEAYLAANGLRTVAVPLDAVIGGAAATNGVRVLSAELSTAMQEVSGEQFDCVLLPNILHLAPDPVGMLGALRNVLSAGSSVIAMVPNMMRPSHVRRLLRGPVPYRNLTTYQATGVHLMAEKTLKKWFTSAGLKSVHTRHLLSSESNDNRRFIPRLATRFLATELMAVGKYS